MNDAERKLIVLEAQLANLGGAFTSLSSRQETQNTLLVGLEKHMLEMRNDVRNVVQSMDRLQKEQETLEREAYEITEKTRKEVQQFGDTLITAIETMTDAFKSAVNQLASAYEAKIVRDIEPRLKKTETFNLMLHGGLVVVTVGAGAAIAKVLNWF